MLELVADANIEGHFRILVSIMRSDDRIDYWRHLDCAAQTFAQLGLEMNAKDNVVWKVISDRDAILITGNRNKKGADSLESAIRSPAANTAFPVMTISDPDRIHMDREFAHQIVAKLYEYLLEIETLRGTGRIYLP